MIYPSGFNANRSKTTGIHTSPTQDGYEVCVWQGGAAAEIGTWDFL